MAKAVETQPVGIFMKSPVDCVSVGEIFMKSPTDYTKLSVRVSGIANSYGNVAWTLPVAVAFGKLHEILLENSIQPPRDETRFAEEVSKAAGFRIIFISRPSRGELMKQAEQTRD